MNSPEKALPREIAMPHMGNLVRQKMQQLRFSQASVARSLGIVDISLSRQLRNASIRSGVLWKAGLAMKYNLFADLAALFPYPPAEGQNPEMEALRTRVRDLEKEVEIYKGLLRREG